MLVFTDRKRLLIEYDIIEITGEDADKENDPIQFKIK